MEGIIFDFNGTLILDDPISIIALKKDTKRSFNYDITDDEYHKYKGIPRGIRDLRNCKRENNW